MPSYPSDSDESKTPAATDQQTQSGTQTTETSTTVTAENFQLTEITAKKSLDSSKIEKR
jgi:hypothetical protein